MYCNKCGSNISDDSKFCIYCGNKVQNEHNLNQQVAYYKSDGTLGYTEKDNIVKNKPELKIDTTKCKHCGKKYPEDALCCPYCAEPNSQSISDEEREWEEQELERKAKNRAARSTDIFTASWSLVIVLPFLSVCLLSFGVKGSTIGIIALISFIVSIIVFPTSAFLFARSHLADESIVKWKQFCTDKTSICPKCGSHSVKIYRKGYNWNEAFWGSVFKIKGSRYIAGMESNTAMCHCEHCGHRWDSGYDFRTIK